MKKKIFWIIILILVLFLVSSFYFINVSNVTENVVEKDNYNSTQNNNSGDLHEFDVDVSDEEITFTSKDGSEAIIYSFDNNRLDKVLYITLAKNDNEANYLKSEYEKKIGDGIIANVETTDRMVIITYDKSYFKEYEQYTKSEIQDMLINNEEFSTLVEDN